VVAGFLVFCLGNRIGMTMLSELREVLMLAAIYNSTHGPRDKEDEEDDEIEEEDDEIEEDEDLDDDFDYDDEEEEEEEDEDTRTI